MCSTQLALSGVGEGGHSVAVTCRVPSDDNRAKNIYGLRRSRLAKQQQAHLVISAILVGRRRRRCIGSWSVHFAHIQVWQDLEGWRGRAAKPNSSLD